MFTEEKKRERTTFTSIRKILPLIVVGLLLMQSVSFAGYSEDITKIGIGARPLGMGKAYTAIADDTSAMFLNPAGIGQIDKPQLLSMQASLLNDVDYLTIGGIAPFGVGSIGLGLVQARVEGIALTELDANDRPRVVEDATYYEGIYVLSYALPITPYVSSLFNTNFKGRIYGGASLKYLSKGVTGYSSAYGTNLDLGVLYITNSNWRFGITQKNAFPSLDALGSVKWSTGAVDYLLSYTTIGIGYEVNPNWLLTSDYDIAFTGGRKALVHLGTEYKLDKSMVLRTGYEQMHDATGGKTFGNMTIGISLMMESWKLDYAYHPYYDQLDTVTHYISLGYKFENAGLAIFERQEPKEHMANVNEPSEKSWE